MRGDGSVEETITTILARDRLLHAILDEPRTKAGLVSELGCSRSTVDRAISELEGLGIAERRGRGYRATTFGRVVTHAFDGLREKLENLAVARDVMATIPDDAYVDSVAFDGADVQFVRAFGPDLVESTFGGADEVRIASPQTALIYASVVHRDDPLSTLTAEFALDGETLDHLERHYPDELRSLVESEGVAVLEVGEQLSFCFAVAASGDRRWLVVHFPFGNDAVAVLTNHTPEAVEWAERTYDRLVEDGRPYAVTLPSVDDPR